MNINYVRVNLALKKKTNCILKSELFEIFRTFTRIYSNLTRKEQTTFTDFASNELDQRAQVGDWGVGVGSAQNIIFTDLGDG